MRLTITLWTLVVPYGETLIVPYAAYNYFVDGSRPLRGNVNRPLCDLQLFCGR